MVKDIEKIDGNTSEELIFQLSVDTDKIIKKFKADIKKLRDDKEN